VDEDLGELETLEEHLGIDADVRFQDPSRKKPENILEFKAYENCHMVPFVLYVDFETFIRKEADGEDAHEPSGFCCLRVSSFDFMNDAEAYVYSGPDVMKHFYEHIMWEHYAINKILATQKPIEKLTKDEQKNSIRPPNAKSVLNNLPLKIKEFATITICREGTLVPCVMIAI